ncbi:group-specific protein [Metabacillus litoralis]|uniref:Group-specific protein n=1 Tax=Metabacillus litoralis TaxID=152268 RepID=A0A5C6W6N9_9BACI|nr:group-specific protein [Metabacillus litoralis]TXC93064.1 group-specific protein [Metabacillus litoralis]
MSSCKIDHSLEDVKKKLTEQIAYLPEELATSCLNYLNSSLKQTELNELFHLLKKYDLASDEEKRIRNKKLEDLFQ